MSSKPTPSKAMPKKPAVKAAAPAADQAMPPVAATPAETLPTETLVTEPVITESVIAESVNIESAAAETTSAPVAASTPAITPPQTTVAIKEPTMTTTFPTFDMTAFKAAFDEMAARAQTAYADAYAKGTEAFAEANEFAKGNAEALVEASKLFTAGLETLAQDFAADSKSTYEALSTDAKALAAAKSPAELVTLHSEFAKKHFDSAIAHGSKNSEALLKLAGDVVAPISNRVSLAVEKVKVAA